MEKQNAFREPARMMLAVSSWVVGAVMVLLALHIQFREAAASASDCSNEKGYYCSPGQACCNGVCFDPTTHACNCIQEVVPIP